jgi:hypothetical protein
VNISVGSSFTTIGADGTMACSFDSKNFLNESRISFAVIIVLYCIYFLGPSSVTHAAFRHLRAHLVSKTVQSYEKTSEMQKESLLFFSFPSVSNFGKAKVTKKACKSEAILED